MAQNSFYFFQLYIKPLHQLKPVFYQSQNRFQRRILANFFLLAKICHGCLQKYFFPVFHPTSIILFKTFIYVICFYTASIYYLRGCLKQMTEDIKMGLRPKRKPKYQHSDEEDPENASYSRPNYVKIHAASHGQEYTSPAVVLNQNAKLLVKFINKSNKDLRDYRTTKESEQKQIEKKDVVSKEKMVDQSVESFKKISQNLKPSKTQPVKKTKQLYNFKGQHQNAQFLKNQKSDQAIKQIKGIQSFSGLMNGNKGIYSGPLSNQLSQLQTLYPNLKDISYQALTQGANPNLFQFNVNGLQMNTVQNPFLSKNKAPKQQKVVLNQEKLFKRSAYHVAIAYHIYLKKLKQQGITRGNQIDPTYNARMVKERGVSYK